MPPVLALCAADAPMKVDVVWDESEGAATVTHERVCIASVIDVLQWKALLLPQLRALYERLGGAFPIAVCFDDVVIRPQAAALYGEVVKGEIKQFATVTARYGKTSMVRAVISAEAVRQGYRINLFDNRLEALRYIRSHLAYGPSMGAGLPRWR